MELVTRHKNVSSADNQTEMRFYKLSSPQWNKKLRPEGVSGL